MSFSNCCIIIIIKIENIPGSDYRICPPPGILKTKVEHGFFVGVKERKEIYIYIFNQKKY